MHMPPSLPWLLVVVSALSVMPFTATVAAGADEVTIFRCVDNKGRLTLRDSPCDKGEQQQIRNMIRPKDAPPRTQVAPVAASTPTATPSVPPQVIVIQPPRPMYECVTPDNQRYLSDTPEGNPRWVPAWTQGYPVLARVPTYEPGQLNVSVNNGHVSGHYSSGGYSETVVATYAGQGGGLWVRDACHPLPEIEVCARLRDRRDELRRRFSIAQPSERAVLGREERGINARLAQDCP